MDPMLGLIALKALRSQDEIRQSIENQAAGRGEPWQGWLSRPRQVDSFHESHFNSEANYFLYPVEEGREQEDILLQRTRLLVAVGQPSWLTKSRQYLVAAAQLGCPSCGSELNFGLYRQCGNCRARLKYVLQCGACDHLRVGVDFRMFGSNLNCGGCGIALRQARDPSSLPPVEPKATCAKCGAEIQLRTAAKYGGMCARCGNK
jgi:hypothetical protein